MKSIDRFEGDKAIIDDNGELYSVERALLPSDADEGDIVNVDDSGTYHVDKEATAQWRLSLRERLRRLCSSDENERQ